MLPSTMEEGGGPCDIPSLRLFVSEAICMLEISMQHVLFYSMEHVKLHLVDKLKYVDLWGVDGSIHWQGTWVCSKDL